MSVQEAGAAIGNAELDALVELYRQYPGALAVDNWKLYRQLLDEVERAENPDITDSYGRVWTWFRSCAWVNTHRPTYTHCGTAIQGDWIAGWGFPKATLADNPNYRLCGTCRRDWPPEAQELYAKVQALRSVCAVCQCQIEAHEWSKAMPYECGPDDLWTYAHFDCRERALRTTTPTTNDSRS